MNHQPGFLALFPLIIGVSSLAVQCGAEPRPSVIEIAEIGTSEELIETEEIPLNNCGGNRPLIVDIERGREVIYAITDEKGGAFGINYLFLKGELEQIYGSIYGKKETRTYTIHLETEPNTRLVYTIAWKEIWLNGKASFRENGEKKEAPFRVKTALKFEIQDIREIGCE
jgi:hypothetical protein